MRSARIFLATAAASAVLAIGAPGAFAAGGDWDNDGSSHGDGSSHSKEHGKEHGKEGRHEPRGGMHTGGGALTAVNDDGDWGGPRDPKTDPDTYRDDSWGRDHDHEGRDHDGGGRGKDSWGGGDHDKPRGGMHTGGGALAAPTATAGGLAVLGVVATGLYAVRRKRPVAGTA